ncbi:MAG TPA: acyltransferase [Pirellulales bacterium]|nr:acyltransferase [Pirellulales bacterium]
MSHDQVRIRELDGLRALAALAVVFFHYTSRYDSLFGHSTPLWFSLPRGDLGVDCFFMLSGYVILMTLDRTASAGDFVVGRFARLYPAYWAAMLVTFAVVTWAGLPGHEVSLGEAVVNVTMLQQLLGARHIDSAYWSLQTELLFYGAMLVLARTGMLSPSRWTTTMTLWLLLATAARTAAEAQPLGVSGPLPLAFVTKLQTVLSLKYLHLFALGIALYRTENAGRRSPTALLLAASCVLVQGRFDSWTAAGVVALLALIVREAVRGRLPFLAARPLVYVGTISYPLYLIHQNVGYVAIRHLEAVGLSDSVAVATAIGGSLLLGAGLSHAVERPAMSAFQGCYRQGRGRLPVAKFVRIPRGR